MRLAPCASPQPAFLSLSARAALSAPFVAVHAASSPSPAGAPAAPDGPCRQSRKKTINCLQSISATDLAGVETDR